MKASYLKKLGGPLTFGELPTPPLTNETARIKVLYCGVHHLDVLIRGGKRPGIPKFPHILGSEIVGTIEEIKSSDGKFASGDTVVVYPWTFCGSCMQCQSGNEQMCDSGGTLGRTDWGGYAQFVVVPTGNLIPIPGFLALNEVCALVLAGTTAQHLVQRAGVTDGSSVLVTGASGGVGTVVIQLLKHKGCTVVAATSHPDKLQRLKQLGADYVVSTTSMAKDIGKIVPGGVPFVIDIVGGSVWSNALTTLAKNGTMVFCSTSREEPGEVPIDIAFSKQLTILGAYGGNRKNLEAILRAYRQGDLKPLIDSTFSLADAAKAHTKIEQQNVFGKILLAA